ncbi:MAG TPA: HNH endonuclease [Methanosarcina sp.]|nr:HNH endonuclease [Methanosarcina sp.]
MPIFANRTCECGTEYTPTGPAAKFCPVCADTKRKEASRRGAQTYRIKNGLIKNPGVGKGGAPTRGAASSTYKNGIAFFMKSRKTIREERRYCERCNVDLISANRWQWVIHHRDHNRGNNTVENFELLCKRCHQIEHDCEKAFLSRATTIPQGSRD